MSSRGAATSPRSSLRPRAIGSVTVPTSARPAECVSCVRLHAQTLRQLPRPSDEPHLQGLHVGLRSSGIPTVPRRPREPRYWATTDGPALDTRARSCKLNPSSVGADAARPSSQ
eukprot:2068999-Alexandrium_andersonii.AAC.1